MTDDEPADRPFDGAMSPARSEFLGTTDSAAHAKVPESARVGGPDTADGAGRVRNLADYLQDPAVFEENREPTHATAAIPYASREGAIGADERYTELEARFDESPYYERLDGEWNFRFFERPADLPATLDDPESWDTITVPRPWQTEGYDRRVYANWRPAWTGYDEDLEWDLYPGDDGRVDVPGVDDGGPNPVGIYNRTMTVPEEWDGRRVFLHFEGIKQASFVWIDGEYVGFHQGSMTPAEFDVTDHVAVGEDHDLTVQVYRWSDAEALECVDMHKYAGIYRSVALFSTPAVHLRDFHVRQELDEAYEDARLRIDGEIVDYSGVVEDEYEVRASLYGPDADATDPPLTTFGASTTVADGGGVAELETEIESPAIWSAEAPNLYTLVLELRPAGGEPTEAFLEKVGFRTFEATRGPDGHVAINGRPVPIRGTNRHEADPDTGRTLPVEKVREDISLLKRFNLNAVRTSHYPNDPTFYRLADEYGLYVQDEVNAETHWWEGVLSGTTAYHEQAVARFRRMLLRDRNHASVFSWSTGNEAGTAAEHLHMAALALGGDDPTIPEDTSDVTRLDGEPVESFDASGIEALAPDRLMFHQPNRGGWDVEYADMLGPRYVEIDTLLGLAAGEDLSDADRFGEHSSGDGSPGDGQRSVVLGEYNHAMGSSLGLVDEIWNDYVQPPVRRARDGAGDHDGVLIGSPTVVPGESAGAVTLGPDDAVEIDGSVDGDLDFAAPGFALEATVRGLPETGATLLGKGDGYALSVTPDAIELSIAPGSDSTGTTAGDGDADDQTVTLSVPRSAVAFDDEEWLTLTGVVESDRLALFLDGTEIGALPHEATTLRQTDARVTIGGVEGADVTIDSIAIYDAPATSDERAESGTPVVSYDFGDLLRDKSLQGGFVWDWINQDVNDETDDGQPYQFYALGSDGAAGEFSLNGMVWSDRRPQPELWQLKQCHQPVKAAERDLLAGELYVTNHHQFTNLGDLEATWTLTADDEVRRSGTLDLDVSPGATEVVRIDDLEPPETPEPGVEYRLNLSFALPEATPWADAGHEVAFAQFDLPLSAPAEPLPTADLPPVTAAETDDGIVLSGESFEYVFDEERGTFSSMTANGTDLVEAGPRFDCWRVPVMNERQDWGIYPAETWRELGLDDLRYEVDAVSVDRTGQSVEIAVEGRTLGACDGDPAGFETTVRYRVYGSGDVVVDVAAEPTDRLVEAIDGWLPKAGLHLEANDALDRFEWYGRGPVETYPDRKTGVPIGRYAGSVADQYVPYLPPSGNGNRAETRWAALTDGDVGLAAFAETEMHVSLDQWANLDEADYQYELEERGSVGLNLDHAVSGVGGTPIPPAEAYRVRPEPTSFSIRLRPLAGGDDPMALSRQAFPDG